MYNKLDVSRFMRKLFITQFVMI